MEKMKLFYIHNFFHHMDETPPHVFENEAWRNTFFETTKQIVTEFNENKLQTLEVMSNEDL